MTETSRPPRSVITAFTLLALLAAGWCIYWFSFRAKLQGDVAELRASLAQAGLQLACGQETWAGFPFRYELTCLQPKLTGTYAGRPVEAGATMLRLYMQAYNPFHIIALGDGPTSLGGNVISHAAARASLRYDTQGNWDAAVELPKPDIASRVSAAMIKIFARVQDGKLQLAAEAEGLKPAAVQMPLLEFSAVAETDAALLLAADPVRLAAENGTPLKITSFGLKSGNIAIEGAGELALDASRKLNGKLSGNVNDLDALLDLLAAPLQLSPEEITGAKTVIGLLGGNQPGKATNIDIIAKSGELFFGPFKIADVPPLD